MKRQFKALFVAALLVAASAAGGTSAAFAETENPDSLTPDELRSQYTNEQLFYTPEIANRDAEAGASSDEVISLSGVDWYVGCEITTERPHYSKRSPGIIYKTRVACRGTGDYPNPVHVNVKTALYHIPADDPYDTDDVNWRQWWNSAAGRWMQVTGPGQLDDPQTWYAPTQDQSGFEGIGFWQGTSIVDITDPVGLHSGSSVTDVIFINSYEHH